MKTAPRGSAFKTIVSFHAHPDDEALYTGGTLARLAAEGHRVVLVTATAGDLGLADTPQGTALAERRRAELRASAEALGCARTVCLDYPDSGSSTEAEYEPAVGTFARVPVEAAAERLASILREERADVLTTYDRRGGYGHRDHVQVHRVGARAAELAATPLVLQATIDRTLMDRVVRTLSWIRRLPAGTSTGAQWYSARDEITHRIDVRRYTNQKRRALAAHRSQAEGGKGPRTVKLLLALPRPVFARVCGTEWFVESGVIAPTIALSDPLTTLRSVAAA
jgi:LmbE family N-acetylglucosaminyl deacetylase